MEDLECLRTKLRGEVDKVSFTNSLSVERSGLCGKRLCSRRSLLTRSRLRHGALHYWPDWLPGCAVKHKNKTMFGNLCQRFYRTAVHNNVREDRRRGRVVIPDVMVCRLEMPHALARTSLNANDACSEQIVSRTVTAVVVTGWCAEWEINKP
jgi:hypothetical protein